MFSNRTLGYRLPQKNREDGAALRGRLVTLGLYRESGHEHFSGSLVIPIEDERGAVVGMYGRKITRNLRPGTPQHLYLPGPHRGVWNVAALREHDDVVLCESLIDALSVWCAGVRNVTTSYGVEGFTSEHREAFRRHGVKRVRIAYDRDEAGDRAAEKLAGELMREGIECFRVEFPRGMDANEYALKVKPAEQSVLLAVNNARWMGAGARPSAAVPEAIAASSTAEVIVEPTPGDRIVRSGRPAARSGEPAPGSGEPAPGSGRGDSPVGVSSFAAEAAPVAATPASIEPSANADELVVVLGDRRWRVRGLAKNTSYEQLRVQVFGTREGVKHGLFVDTLDLYSSRSRGSAAKQAAEDLGVAEEVVKKDLGELLRRLESEQDRRMKELLAPKDVPKAVSDEERAEAMALLRDPKLLERIVEDFERCGVVGERTNLLVGYLAATSRKLEEPLAVVIQSSSAAGKSSLMDAVLALIPEQERVQYSAMTGQSLFYMGDQNLKHKVLAIVEEEGAERASYALKLPQSEGELTIASTGKDPLTGRLVTHAYRVEGPVMIFLTTTAIEVDEELLNRCLVLTVDEGREQTRAIHARQRSAQTLAGLLRREEKKDVVRLHQNAQRLIAPLAVVNPFAEELTFADGATRTRRDHMKYLTLIRTVALLRQHQREVKTAEHRGRVIRYVEATRADVEDATRLAAEALGRSLSELPPQTKKLLSLVRGMVAAMASAKASRGARCASRSGSCVRTRGGATRRSRCTSGGWWSSSTCTRTGWAEGRRASTSSRPRWTATTRSGARSATRYRYDRKWSGDGRGTGRGVVGVTTRPLSQPKTALASRWSG